MKSIQIAALAVIAVFYIAYFAKMILQRRKGVKTDQIGKGSKPRKVLVIEILMKIATYSVVAVEVVSIIMNFRMWKSSYAWIGIGVAALGVLVFIVAMVTMRDSWRAGIPEKDKTELVTTGIYRISRNPAFLGFDLMYIGLLITFFNYLHLIFVLFAVIMLHLQIVNVEEDFLLETFGDDYLNYKKRVNRYLGKKSTKKKVRLKSVLKWVGISILALILAAVLFVCIVRGVTYFSNRIDTANGVDEGIYVTLGGQEQYLLIRGENVENPVMIWLHGGPASPDAFANYTFQKHLVDEYTVVNWDQRGCGRTYYRNKDADPNNETTSFEQAQADLDELVDYLADRFHTDKVIIVGHSYGAMLGSKYTLEHPDKVAAYIGVGQFVDMESEVYSYEDALEIAKAKGDDVAAMEEAYKAYSENPNLVNMRKLRVQVSKYHPVPREANTIWSGVASPYTAIYKPVEWCRIVDTFLNK